MTMITNSSSVPRKHPQPGVDLTYVKRAGEANGDAGDPYVGLDRFGRIVDQRWLKSSDGSALDRLQYSYDRNGNRVGGGYVVGPGNRLLADGTWSYSYDAEGNLVGKTHLVTGDSWTYSYDHRNQMTRGSSRVDLQACKLGTGRRFTTS
jgi:RHS Repeat.